MKEKQVFVQLSKENLFSSQDFPCFLPLHWGSPQNPGTEPVGASLRRCPLACALDSARDLAGAFVFPKVVEDNEKSLKQKWKIPTPLVLPEGKHQESTWMDSLFF